MRAQNAFGIFGAFGTIIGFIILLGGLILLSSVLIVNPGERGVVFNIFSGLESSPRNPGVHILTPIIESAVNYGVLVRKLEVPVAAASKDLQEVNAIIALNFHLVPEDVITLHKELGPGAIDTVVAPAIQESVKASTALYTAEALITKRELVKEDIRVEIASRLSKRYMIVDEVSIVDLDFSASFNKAIEEKVTAEQEAMKAQRDLERIRIESEQTVVKARASAESLWLDASAKANATLMDATAKAEALRIQKEALVGAPELVQYKAIEKWDGVLPRVTSGAVPFIDVSVVQD